MVVAAQLIVAPVVGQEHIGLGYESIYPGPLGGRKRPTPRETKTERGRETERDGVSQTKNRPDY